MKNIKLKFLVFSLICVVLTPLCCFHIFEYTKIQSIETTNFIKLLNNRENIEYIYDKNILEKIKYYEF